jgi:hypothetical protein
MTKAVIMNPKEAQGTGENDGLQTGKDQCSRIYTGVGMA